MQIMKKIKKVFESFCNLTSKEKDELLLTLLTEKEINEFETRLEILQGILNWKTQREIASDLWISITTVTRWSKVIKESSNKIKEIFKYV